MWDSIWEEKGLAIWTCKGRTFLAEETASAKAITPSEQKQIATKISGLKEECPVGCRMGSTVTTVRDVLGTVIAMSESNAKHCPIANAEKTALNSGSPYTWSQGESLEDLSRPERIAEIEADYERRVEREKQLRRRNPLIDDSLADELEIDELYGVEEGAGACVVCHK